MSYLYAPATVVDVRTQGAGTLAGYQIDDGPFRGQSFVAQDARESPTRRGAEVIVRILNDGPGPSTSAVLAPRTVAPLGDACPWPTIEHARRIGWATWWEISADVFARGVSDSLRCILDTGHVGVPSAHDGDGTPIAAVYWTSMRQHPGVPGKSARYPRHFVRQQRIDDSVYADVHALESLLIALQAPIRSLTCSCCLQPAGAWRQWHNRDVGFGVCGSCIARMDRESPAEIRMRYGVPGVHFPHYAIG